MEHEVFVAVSAERLRQALADPARVAGAIPGLQQDEGTDPVTGRLKVRVGGHTITYRGTLRVEGRDDGSFTVEGQGAEARGTGTAKLSLSLRLTPAEDGTTVTFTGTATADGRIADLPGETVATAGTRLLGRFAENLGEAAGETSEEAAADGEVPDEEAAEEVAPQGEAPRESAEPPSQQPGPEEEPASAGDIEVPELPELPELPEVPEVPPSSLDPLAGESEPGLTPDTFDQEPPAEAAHARRTMIGRSAEEVDHAPPRGRYAPVPPPEAAAATATLRWAAPAAALLVASAIMAGRLLRRRR